MVIYDYLRRAHARADASGLADRTHRVHNHILPTQGYVYSAQRFPAPRRPSTTWPAVSEKREAWRAHESWRGKSAGAEGCMCDGRGAGQVILRGKGRVFRLDRVSTGKRVVHISPPSHPAPSSRPARSSSRMRARSEIHVASPVAVFVGAGVLLVAAHWCGVHALRPLAGGNLVDDERARTRAGPRAGAAPHSPGKKW
ncbi:hypothetical protein FIBSPDRAFT_267516 [Athelia psychrophila]|uniref:Uncharacterized protein n=1 Tax=Athelia psychrophila TaxID=1759441 RepID=A0A166RGN7_9AGAM|nr:hypothetical protein FIBSPDRAFT_267516 [Fibularhizoctonia sp. CBS 109695]